MKTTVANIEKKGTKITMSGVDIRGYADEFKNVNIVIEKGKSIRIMGERHGIHFNRETGKIETYTFDKTFALGVDAIYDGYNFDYTSAIKSIGEKRIAIADRSLDLGSFILKNYDYDAAKIAARRQSWSD